MATKVFTASDVSLSSNWTAYLSLTYGTTYISPDPPPTATSTNRTFAISGIPAGSTINSATLTGSLNSPYTGARVRKVEINGGSWVSFSGSLSVKTALVALGGSYSTFPVRFQFGANGSTDGATVAGTAKSSQLNITNLKLTVDYTEPASVLTLNKTSCKAGDVIRANITPASSSATHKVKFAMTGVTTVTYTLAAGTNYKDFTIPLAWQDEIPSATSRTVTVTLETYSGSTMTGDVDKTFTMTLSDDNYPSITDFTIGRIPGHAVAALTFFIQHFSQANLNAIAAGLYSATITQYRFISGAWSQTGNNIFSPVLTAAGTIPFTVEVTDSRGRKSSMTQNITVEPYPPPVLDAPVVRRSDALGQAAINGTYVYINSGLIIASLQNLNTATLKARIYLKGTAAPAWNDSSVITLAPGTPSITGNRLISNSYTIDLLVTDKLASYLFTAEIPTAKALLSGLPGVTGAGIGLFAERENALTSAWPLWVQDDPVCHIRVGDLRISKDPTSPALIWPGTSWAELKDRMLVGAGNLYTVGIPGGEATHTLTAAELAAHTHGQRGSGANYAYAQVDSSGSGSSGTVTGVGDLTTLRSNRVRIYTSSNENAGAAHNNMPPYDPVYMWERTA